MTQSRDRDEHGRPRNARPRDALGRPLPRQAEGADPQPEPVYVSATQTLDSAQRLLDAGRPFHAHEVLEAAWKGAPDSERDLWQGLAQIAVGITHAARGNPTGAITLLARGRAHLDASDSPPDDVDVPGLQRWVDESSTLLRGSVGALVLTTPTLRHGYRVARLIRWEAFGGTWQVEGRSRDELTISLRRCDGGEEVDRWTTSDHDLIRYVQARRSHDHKD